MGPAFPKPVPREKKRRRWLRRNKAIVAARSTRRRSGRDYDEPWLNSVRSLSWCSAARAGATTPCRWWFKDGEPITEADHMGWRPLGRKSHDRETGPMCHGHHQERTAGQGWFWGWTRERMREFCVAAVAAVTPLVLAARELCCCNQKSKQCEGRLYLCAWCRRWAPWCFGAADNQPDICDDCWAAGNVDETDSAKTGATADG